MTSGASDTPGSRVPGDAELAALGAVLSEPPRARIMLALGDGRALTASGLAAEAGVAPSTASGHLRRLVAAGLLVVRPQGRHRYYALASPQVGELVATLARLAPSTPVRSLREGTREHAVRRARTCYGHLAGRLGVALFEALLQQGLLTGGDGRHKPDEAHRDHVSAVGRDLQYRLTGVGHRRLSAFGVALPEPDATEGIDVRYCIDWTEQAHHLSGMVGDALTERMFELGWLDRMPRTRAVQLSASGAQGLRDEFAVSLPEP